MELHDRLREILREHFNWGKPRLDCFVGMLLALLTLKHINLTQLALAFSSDAELNSRYRRLQRFFGEVVFDYDALASLIMGLFSFHDTDYYLTLDRTNWKWGRSNINILTLGIVYKQIAVPVYWMILNKQGNSNQRERIALLERFIREFTGQRVLGILGDREFIGGDWWKWLDESSIPYLIRIKKNQHVLQHGGKTCLVERVFAHLCVNQSC